MPIPEDWALIAVFLFVWFMCGYALGRSHERDCWMDTIDPLIRKRNGNKR